MKLPTATNIEAGQRLKNVVEADETTQAERRGTAVAHLNALNAEAAKSGGRHYGSAKGVPANTVPGGMYQKVAQGGGRAGASLGSLFGAR